MLTDQKKLILIVQKRGKRERCFLRVAKSKKQKWNSFNIRACTTKDRVKTTELRLRLARDGERKGWKKIRMIIIQHRHRCNLFAETEAVIRHCWSFSNCVTFIINKKIIIRFAASTRSASPLLPLVDSISFDEKREKVKEDFITKTWP